MVGYRIITKPKQLKKVIEYCKQTGYASIDFETNAEPVRSDLFYPTILGISFQPGFGWILPLAHFDSPFKKRDRWVKLLKQFGEEVIQNKDIIKIGQNLKFEGTIFKRYGIEMRGRVFDTMLAKYLLDEEKPMGLKPMVARFIPEYAGYEENYEGSKLPWDKKPLEGLSKYCALDCSLTFQLMIFFEHKLIKTKLYALFRNMMMMGTRVLIDSEYNGIDIDEPYLDDLMVKYENKIAEVEKELRSIPKLIKFEKWLSQNRINKLIDKVNEEINDLIDVIEDLKADAKKEKDPAKRDKIEAVIRRKEKSIQGREDKVDRYMARELTTKAELKCLEPTNFNSPPQMGDLFFNSPKGFKFKVVKYTTDKAKNETNTPSTDEEVLTTLANVDKSGFCKKLLEYRGLGKLYSTYIKGIKEKITNGKVHGRFLLEGTVTGRLSSQNPNLQNIPRDTTSSDIKKMFIPPPGRVLLQLDYSQAELRVMAAMAGEKTMIKWFKEGRDIHITTALKMYHQEDRYDEIAEVIKKEEDDDPRYLEWKVKRKYAKTINFGIIYGQGPPKLADALGWTVEEAKDFLKAYFKLFPKVKEFINKQHKFAQRNAYVKNVFGRKRRLWDVDSHEKWLVAQALRQSVNAPIQGAASDYTLFSSILIWEKCRTGEIAIDLPQCYTVHDSLGYFVKPENLHTVVPQLQKICENPETLEWFGFQIDDVTMKVDFEVSHKNWGELKSYDPNFDYTSLF